MGNRFLYDIHLQFQHIRSYTLQGQSMDPIVSYIRSQTLRNDNRFIPTIYYSDGTLDIVNHFASMIRIHSMRVNCIFKDILLFVIGVMEWNEASPHYSMFSQWNNSHLYR